MWNRHFGGRSIGKGEVVQVPTAGEAMSERLTEAYSNFSKKAEVHTLMCGGGVDGMQAKDVGRGQDRIQFWRAVAPRSRRPERYYHRTANETCCLKYLVCQLARARKRRVVDTGEETTEHEKTLVRRMLPLLRGAMEGTEGGKPSEFRSLMDVLLDLGEETAGGLPVAGLRLAVAAVKLDKVILRQVQRAGNARYTDFKQWVVDHLSGGGGALHKFSNKGQPGQVRPRRGAPGERDPLLRGGTHAGPGHHVDGLVGRAGQPRVLRQGWGAPVGLAPQPEHGGGLRQHFRSGRDPEVLEGGSSSGSPRRRPVEAA